MLLAILAISITRTQETWEDEEKEALEKNAIAEEKNWRFEMPDGQHLTLNNLRKKRAPDYIFKKTSEEADYTYYFNICSPTIMTCNGEEDAIAMQKIGPEWTAILGRGRFTQANYIDDTQPCHGVKLRYEGGDLCSAGERKTEFILKCDDNIEFETESVEETETWLYTITIRTKYTCNFYPNQEALYARENELNTATETYYSTRTHSIWSKKIVKILFFIIVAFVILNVYLFYQNLKKDPYRNYSRAIPFREKYRQIYRAIASKF